MWGRYQDAVLGICFSTLINFSLPTKGKKRRKGQLLNTYYVFHTVISLKK